MECGSYRGIKLLEHAMKTVKRILEDRIRQQIDIDNMQFGFMKGKGTTDTIFIFYCKTDAGEVYSKRKEALFWLCGFGKSFC